MQSTHSVIAVSATTPSSVRTMTSTATLPATGQLGPTPAIPTLKQLQDHHIKVKQITTTNNNNFIQSNNNHPAQKPMAGQRTPTVVAVPAEQPKRPFLATKSADEDLERAGRDADVVAATSEPPVKRARQDADEADSVDAVFEMGAPLIPTTTGIILAMDRPLMPSVLQYTPSSFLTVLTPCPLGPPPGAPLGPPMSSMVPSIVPHSSHLAVPPCVTSPSTIMFAGPSAPPVVVSRPPSAERPPSAGPPRPSSAGPSRPTSAGSSRPSSAGPSRPPSAGPSRPPSAGPTRPSSAGPSRPSSAGPSRPASARSSHDLPADDASISHIAYAGSSSRPASSGSSRTSGSARPATRPSQSSPLRGKHRAIRAQSMEENREGLLECVKHVPESFQAVLRQHVTMQLALGRTQAALGNSIMHIMHKAEMIASYQPWVILTYGDAAKTKTITLTKYARIVRTLRGEEVNSAENSKFRFWVRSKGFRLGAPDAGGPRKPADDIAGSYGVNTHTGHLYIDETGQASGTADAPPLYIPTGTSKEEDGRTVPVYKRVAVVENFFDIIYTVHVDIEGRGNKHAGQKRTYRTITDSYSFLPREAVTRFLLGCTECNKRPRSPTSPARPSASSASSAIAKEAVDEDSAPSHCSSPPASPAPSVSASTSRALSPGPSTSTAGLLSPGLPGLPGMPSRLHALASEHTGLFQRYGEPSPPHAESSALGHSYPVMTSMSSFLPPTSTPPSSASTSDGHLHYPYLSSLSRPSGSSSILSGRSGPSAFHSPAESQSLAASPSAADDAETHLPSLQDVKPQHPVFLHSASGRQTDVSLTPLKQSVKLASSPFSIENISKSSRSSPTPPASFAVPDPPKARTPPRGLEDNFLVPRPPKPRSSSHLMPYKVPPRLPYGDTDHVLLRPLEAIAGHEPTVRMPVPVRTLLPPRPPPPTRTSSIMAGYEPAAGSGLLNLLLKTGVLRNSGPRTLIPEAGEIDLSLPITTTYLKHMRSLGYNDEDALKIDVEMSLYQHVLGVPLRVVDDYL